MWYLAKGVPLLTSDPDSSLSQISLKFPGEQLVWRTQLVHHSSAHLEQPHSHTAVPKLPPHPILSPFKIVLWLKETCRLVIKSFPSEDQAWHPQKLSHWGLKISQHYTPGSPSVWPTYSPSNWSCPPHYRECKLDCLEIPSVTIPSVSCLPLRTESWDDACCWPVLQDHTESPCVHPGLQPSHWLTALIHSQRLPPVSTADIHRTWQFVTASILWALLKSLFAFSSLLNSNSISKFILESSCIHKACNYGNYQGKDRERKSLQVTWIISGNLSLLLCVIHNWHFPSLPHPEKSKHLC